MGVVPTDPAPSAANRGGQPQTFWQRIAQSLDRLAVDRSQRTVSPAALRRSKYEFERCRRMLHGFVAPAPASIDRAPSLRAIKTMQTRT